jgi:ubiquinol-cytochrome c reductase cytochrome b subunit
LETGDWDADRPSARRLVSRRGDKWYFLGLFEFLKLIPPRFEVAGTCIVPGLITVGMFLLPWLDRSPSRHPARRQWIINVGLLVVFGIGILTLKGMLAS